MKSITIHDLDDPLYSLLKIKSKEDGSSLNKTIKKLLEQTLGIKKSPGPAHDDFKEFCGSWNSNDLKEFETAVKETDAVDPGDWK